jgi:hypothetical protein
MSLHLFAPWSVTSERSIITGSNSFKHVIFGWCDDIVVYYKTYLILSSILFKCYKLILRIYGARWVELQNLDCTVVQNRSGYYLNFHDI